MKQYRVTWRLETILREKYVAVFPSQILVANDMKVSTGKVVGGKVVLEGEPLTEGSVVIVVAREEDETFEVSHAEERALLAAIAEAERGEVVSWEELRERLRP